MKKNLIYWSIGGVATAVAVYFLYKKITAPTLTFGEIDEIEDNEVITPKPPKPVQTDVDFPLKKGSVGNNVRKLQRFLKSKGLQLGTTGANNDGVDGIFGEVTKEAVKMNQQPFVIHIILYPDSIEGQVSESFFNKNIKTFY